MALMRRMEQYSAPYGAESQGVLRQVEHSERLKVLGRKLATVRKNVLRLTQKELAQRLTEAGVPNASFGSIRRYEAGEREPGADYVAAIAGLSRVGVAWFFHPTDDSPPEPAPDIEVEPFAPGWREAAEFTRDHYWGAPGLVREATPVPYRADSLHPTFGEVMEMVRSPAGVSRGDKHAGVGSMIYVILDQGAKHGWGAAEYRAALEELRGPARAVEDELYALHAEIRRRDREAAGGGGA
jgi:transcriptional regulator with XRE-family HTH domain